MFGATYHLVFDFANFAKRTAHAARARDKHPIVLALSSLASWKRQFGGSFVFALEGEAQVDRRALYAGYKANRVSEGKSTSDADIDKTCGRILFICGQLRGHLIRQPAFEADDAIAAFVHANQERTVVISADRDLWVLTKLPHVSVYVDNPMTSPDALVDQARIDKSLLLKRWENMGEYHLDASNITMFKALYGDTSDNLPVTVPRLKFADIVACFDACHDLDPDKFFAWLDTADAKVRARVDPYRTKIRIMYEVVRLRYQVPILTEELPGDSDNFLLALRALGAHDAAKYTEILFR